jgi:hypothetical protein
MLKGLRLPFEYTVSTRFGSHLRITIINFIYKDAPTILQLYLSLVATGLYFIVSCSGSSAKQPCAFDARCSTGGS